MMRLMAAAFALCATLLMTIGVFGSTPAEAGYRGSHHRVGFHHGHGYRGGHHRSFHRGFGVVRTGYYGGRGYYGERGYRFGHGHHGYRVGYYGGHSRPYGYGVGGLIGAIGSGIDYHFGGYRYHPGYVRGYGCGGCGGGCSYSYGGCNSGWAWNCVSHR